MRNLIYQVSVGQNTPGFYKICMKSVEDYCSKHNITYIKETEAKLKIRPVKSQRSVQAVERLGYLPIFEKEVAFDYLDDYDNICIIDADIYIRDNAPNIFEQLDDDTIFAGVLEKDMPLTPQYVNKIKTYSKGQYERLTNVNWNQSPTYGFEFYNMGLMLFSSKIKEYLNGDTPEEFIKRKEFERFVNGEGNWKWSTDQTLLNYWVRESGMKLKNLDWKWNSLFKGVKDEVLTESYFIHFFLSGNLPQKGNEIPKIIRDLDQAASIKGHG